ncbi:hypothetical protein [Candidatus Leptofilum sp.]|uniref:hypothetical protein n=1 Tax=Candidatus Leptofilum sp. TaxID=3241576 RepID=UPI003B5C9AC2
MLDTDFANQLHETPKIIAEQVIWKPLPGDRYRIDVKVLAPELNEVLRLKCFYGKTNHSFAILYKNYPIRRYDYHPYHKSRSTGEIFRGSHKHIWERHTQNDKAYVPNDISPNWDINEQFMGFLSEENISLTGGYQNLMFSR